MTIPGVPWFVSGRTRHVGWSYTYAHADNVDVIAERIRSAEALVGDSYQPLRRRDERVEIRGRPSELWSFFENDYGTVLGSVDGEVDRPCIRTTGFRETHRVMSAAPRLLECRSVDDLLAVQREIRCTSLEAVMADVHGDIASVVTGQVDERPSGWSGAYPRPGWQLEERNPQPLSEQFRPHSVRPACGHLASANQGGQGAGPAAFCTLPEPHYRFARISELLAAKPRHSLASLVGISYDTFDRCALRLLAVWGALLPVHPRAQALFRWREEQRDRELLGLFHRLHSELCIAFFERDLGPADAARLRDQLALLHFQHHLDSVLALEHPELLDAVGLTALLDQAFARANSPPGKHSLPLRVRFKHLLTQGLSPALLGFDSKPIELPGGPMSAFTCRSTSVVDGYDVVGGPVFHLALDMKRPGIWYNIAGGASEARWGEGYGKGLDDWLKGKLIPMGDDGAARPLLAEPTDRPSV
jgi:acyl-homoserine lactone acylase PvdQ